MTNDSGFLTSHQDLSNYVTLNDAQTIPGNKTFSGLTKTTGKLPYSLSENDLDNAIYNLETTYWDPDTANKPSSSYGTLLSLNLDGNVHTSASLGWIAQLGIGTDTGLYLRTKTNTNRPWSSWKEFLTTDGGSVMAGDTLGRIDNNYNLILCGGTDFNGGASVVVNGGSRSIEAGVILFHPKNSTQTNDMWLWPDGTWTWSGTACQITSDQRLKQQISQIDDKLLDAWEDVELSQFKYNEAVSEKGNTARLHTGYVVQQINEACQKHNVDISEYGLYCHEEYPERTEEVEVTQDDGSIKKETKVIEPAKEHYSLRYTETLVVECAYLRREVSRLKQQNENLEQRLKMLEQSVK